MKPSSTARKTVSRATAKNAALVNQLATPGLGSLMGHRWFEGAGQLALSVTGFVLVIVWFVQEMIPYYGQMFNAAPPAPTSLKLLAIGSAMFALAWVWSLATSFSLLREATSVKKESLENLAAGNAKFDEAKIILALTKLPQWTRSGEIISRTFVFKDFPAAMKFVDAVADAAEDAWHHPDIDIRWNKVTLALTTHDAGGLTEQDFALAKKFDALALRK